jgi:hypothetical protein
VENWISFEWSRLQTFLPRNLEGEQKGQDCQSKSQVLIQLEGTLETQNQNSWGFNTASVVKNNLTHASPRTTNLEPAYCHFARLNGLHEALAGDLLIQDISVSLFQ